MILTDPQPPYDILRVIETLADGGEFLEVQSEYAPNLVVEFIRLDGYPGRCIGYPCIGYRNAVHTFL